MNVCFLKILILKKMYWRSIFVIVGCFVLQVVILDGCLRFGVIFYIYEHILKYMFAFSKRRLCWKIMYTNKCVYTIYIYTICSYMLIYIVTCFQLSIYIYIYILFIIYLFYLCIYLFFYIFCWGVHIYIYTLCRSLTSHGHRKDLRKTFAKTSMTHPRETSNGEARG